MKLYRLIKSNFVSGIFIFAVGMFFLYEFQYSNSKLSPKDIQNDLSFNSRSKSIQMEYEKARTVNLNAEEPKANKVMKIKRGNSYNKELPKINVRTKKKSKEYKRIYHSGVTKMDNRMLMYNRVPKSGSETLTLLITALSHLNDFKHRRSSIFNKRQLSIDEQDFEECVRTGDPECSFITGQSYDLAIPYFCGHKEECMSLNNRAALELAITNVKKYYVVVGVLEEMNKTLAVLEGYIPRFFKGAPKLYSIKPKVQNQNFRKKKVSEEIKKILKKNLTMEYEFYKFICKRLYDQYKLLKPDLLDRCGTLWRLTLKGGRKLQKSGFSCKFSSSQFQYTVSIHFAKITRLSCLCVNELLLSERCYFEALDEQMLIQH
ncbi:uncharacterized protein LOC143255146 isoform X3 [Tachypleus tridentatus]|uniref:uncharacterized protein LOC143255146 isoform X3 n=1 Tax=Tachypleus tridentatus TaxID=6853 RepID=UPI003FD2529C